MDFIKITTLLSLLTLCGCSTKETTISDGVSQPYRQNTLIINVVDDNNIPINGASVSVGDEYSDVAYGLIKEIETEPLITDINGLVTLSSSRRWGKQWASENECIIEGEIRYCRNISLTENTYTENIIIKKDGFKPIKINYNKVINCREVGASCQTKVINNSTIYFVQYKATLLRD